MNMQNNELHFKRNMNMQKKEIGTKKIRPLLAAFLSFISLGLGQVYNGELRKGLMLNIIFCAALLVSSLKVYIEGFYDLIILISLLLIYIVLKLFSIVQSFIRARKLNSAYSLRNYNRFYFYVLFTVVFLFLSVFLSQVVPQYAVTHITAYHPFRSAKARKQFLKYYDMKAAKWPVASETRMVGTSFGQTFVRISGPIDAPPLVLLHGGGGNSLQWMYSVEAFAKQFRIYAVDNIYDNGRSVYIRQVRSPEDFANWLNEVFNVLELGESINLVGLSYGGWVASQYALHHPERLSKVVLIAPAGTLLPLSTELIKRASLCMIPHRYFIKDFMFWLLEDFAKKNESNLQMLEEELDFAFLAIRSFKSKSLVNPTVLSDHELQSIKIPVLFLVGKNEKIYSAAEAIKRLKHVAPRIEAQIIPGAGHDLVLVHTELVNKKIIDFLTKTPG